MHFISWRFAGDADVGGSKEILQRNEKAWFETATKANTKT